jgi:hypothetical protein
MPVGTAPSGSLDVDRRPQGTRQDGAVPGSVRRAKAGFATAPQREAALCPR